MAGNHSNPPATSAFAHVFDSCPDGDEREVLCEPLLDVTADGVRARVVDGIRTSEHIHLYFRCWTEGRRLQLCLTPSAATGRPLRQPPRTDRRLFYLSGVTTHASERFA